MRRKRRKLDPEHLAATQLAARCHCLGCGGMPCVPAHWPRHQGSGGRFDHPWHPDHWVPLCFTCHDAIDRRNGTSEARTADTKRVEAQVAAKAPAWHQAARRYMQLQEEARGGQ
jgi:hypothetical protein